MDLHGIQSVNLTMTLGLTLTFNLYIGLVTVTQIWKSVQQASWWPESVEARVLPRTEESFENYQSNGWTVQWHTV